MKMSFAGGFAKGCFCENYKLGKNPNNLRTTQIMHIHESFIISQIILHDEEIFCTTNFPQFSQKFVKILIFYIFKTS
jgi:hypothetical protein